MTRGLSQREFAREHGLSKSWVNRLVTDGRIPTLANGLIDREAGKRALERYVGLRGSRQTAALWEARARREELRAKLAELRYGQATGRLLDRALLFRELQQMCATTRTRVRGIPRSMAPILVGRPAAEVEELLTEAFDRALAAVDAQALLQKIDELSHGR